MEKVSEQVEEIVFGLWAQIRIRSRPKRAVGDLHPAAYCFPLVKDDDETELEARRQKIVESFCLKRCYLRSPCHRLAEKVGDGIAKAEKRLRVLTRSRNFLLMFVWTLSHCR